MNSDPKYYSRKCYVRKTSMTKRGLVKKVRKCYVRKTSMTKRGLVKKVGVELEETLFQGFTPYLDTLLNVRMSLPCVRVQKVERRLVATEGAITLAMIDDAVHEVSLNDDISEERLNDLTESHYSTTFSTCAKIGAELDTVKTIYSTHAFVYLNKYYCSGALAMMVETTGN